MTFAELLNEKRKADGISQVVLAKKLGVTQQTVSRWLSGEIPPRRDNLAKLAKFLGVSQSELVQLVYGKPPRLTEIKRLTHQVEQLSILTETLTARLDRLERGRPRA